MSRIGKSEETESGFVVAQGWEFREMRDMTANVHAVLLGVMKMF